MFLNPALLAQLESTSSSPGPNTSRIDARAPNSRSSISNSGEFSEQYLPLGPDEGVSSSHCFFGNSGACRFEFIQRSSHTSSNCRKRGASALGSYCVPEENSSI